VKILSRYILKEFLSNVVLGLVIFTFVLLLDKLFELADLLLNKGVGIALTLRLLFLLLPSSLSLTLPMSVLLATLLTFGRLSENSEITAVRASGLSAWSYVKMPLAAALVAALFLIPFNTRWAPHAHASFRQLYLQVLKRNPLVRIEEKTFVEIGDYHLFVERKDKKTKLMRGVTIYKIPVDGPPLRIFAERGTASVDSTSGITFLLQDGRIEKVDARDPTQWTYTSFGNYQLLIPMGSAASTSERALEEMDNPELSAEISRLKSKNLPYPVLSCQRHIRWALAVTPILFALLGIPLAVSLHRGGRSLGFALSLMIMVLYYVMVMGGSYLGQRGQWPPWLAIWLGNVVMLAGASGLFWRFAKQ
jgi:lipopolysaccharide export system permease protein